MVVLIAFLNRAYRKLEKASKSRNSLVTPWNWKSYLWSRNNSDSWSATRRQYWWIRFARRWRWTNLYIPRIHRLRRVEITDVQLPLRRRGETLRRRGARSLFTYIQRLYVIIWSRTTCVATCQSTAIRWTRVVASAIVHCIPPKTWNSSEKWRTTATANRCWNSSAFARKDSLLTYNENMAKWAARGVKKRYVE